MHIYVYTQANTLSTYTNSSLTYFTIIKQQICFQVFQVNDMKHLSSTVTVKLNFVLHFDYKLEKWYINSVLRIRLKKAIFIKLLLW